MFHSKPLVAIAFLCLFAMIMGCSGGSPVAPEKEAGSMDSIPVIGLTEVGDTFNAIGLLGAYELMIDTEKMVADLVAKRTSTAIGDSFIISGLPFFTMTPCSDCLKVLGLALTIDGDAELSLSLSHPFEEGSMSLPPNAGNRRDLNIFDTAMVVVPLLTTPVTYAGLGASVYEGVCVGADGYTTELANVFSTPDTAAMPYFLVVDDSTDVSPPVSTFNEFAMGVNDVPFEVVFDVGSGIPLRFDLYLTFGYGAAARGGSLFKDSFLAPDYRLPEYNRKAAWKVVVTPPVEWLDNETDPSETKDVLVAVYDWQVGATVSPDWASEPLGTSSIYEASEITSVEVEVLGVTGMETTGVGTGAPDDPVVFTVPIANTTATPAGLYNGLVKVTDSRTVATDFVEGQDFLIETPDGVLLNNVLINQFVVYQSFPAVVIVGCGPPVVQSVTGMPTAPIQNGTSHAITVTATSNDATVVMYELDNDYDGSVFNPVYSDAGGNFPAVVFDSSPCTIGDTFDVRVRITDDCDPPDNQAEYDLGTVEIGQCCGPINGTGWFVNNTCPISILPGTSVIWDIGGVTCPGGTVEYQIDLDWGGMAGDFQPDLTDPDGLFDPYVFALEGTYTIGFRAVDSCTPQGIYTFPTFCVVTAEYPCFPDPESWTTAATGTNNYVYNETNTGIWYSSYGRRRTYGLKVQAYGDDYIYTSFLDLGDNLYFMRSADSGETWSTPFLIRSDTNQDIEGWAMDAVDNQVFIVYNDESLGDMMFRKSTDNGSSWGAPITARNGSTGYAMYNVGLAVDPSNPAHLVCTFTYSSSPVYGTHSTYYYHMRSADGGNTWTAVNTYWGGSQCYQADLCCGPTGTFYIARFHNSYIYVRKSVNGGVSWTTCSNIQNGVPPGMLFGWGVGGSIITDPTDDDTLFVTFYTTGTNTSYPPRICVFKTTDGGTTWGWGVQDLEDDIETGNGLLDMPMQSAIAFDDAGDIYVAFTFCLDTYGDHDIYAAKSCDLGSSWSDCFQMSPDSRGYDVCPALTMDEADGGVVLTWLEDGYTHYYGPPSYANYSGYIRARHLQEQ